MKYLPVVLLLVLISACSQEEAAAPPPPPVIVGQPVVKTVQEYWIFTGVTRAKESADIHARVSGILEEMHFEPSHLVAEGALLFTIEQEYYRAVRGEARAQKKAAEADLALKESELERIERAIATNAVSELDLDRAQAERDKADAAVMLAQATLSKAELDYSYTEVRAPFDGLVSRNLVDMGNLVGDGQATHLTTINKMQPMYIYFDVPEALLLERLEAENRTVVAEDDPDYVIAEAFIATATSEGFPIAAEIDYIDNTVNAQTGTIQLRAVYPNEKFALFPGLFVRVKVMGGVLDNSVMISERAVGTDLGGKFVMLVGEDGIVEQRYVTPDDLVEDGMIRMAEGLEGNETYIIEGLLKARPGRPVTPLTPEQAEQMAQQARQGG